VRVVPAYTVSDAVRSLRRPPYAWIAGTLLVILALLAGFATTVGVRQRADADRAARANLAATLDVAAEQTYSQQPDRAVLQALAAYRIDPDDPRPRDSVLEALYQDTRLGGILPASHGRPSALAVSAHTVAAGASDGSVSVYDVPDRRVTTVLRPDVGPIRVTTFAPDPRWLASGGDDGVVVRDLTTGRTAWRMPGVAVTGIAFAPDSHRIALTDNAGDMITHDLALGTTVTVPVAHQRLRAVAFLSATTLAVGGDDRAVDIYDLGPQPPRRLTSIGTDSAITSITPVVSTDAGKSFYFSEYNGLVHAYDPNTFKPAHDPVRAAIASQVIALVGGGLLVTTPGAVQNVSIDSDTGRFTKEDWSYSGGVAGGVVAATSDGRLVTTVSASGAILLWQRPVARPDVSRIVELTGAYPIPGTSMLLAAIGGDVFEGSALALVGRATGRLIDVVRPGGVFNGVFGSPLLYDAKDKIAVVYTRQGTAWLYRVEGRKLVTIGSLAVSGARPPITAIAFEAARDRLLVARGAMITAVQLRNLKHVTENLLYHHSGQVQTIQVSPNGEHLALGVTSGVTVFTLDSDGFVSGNGQQISTQLATQMTIPDDNTIITGDVDGSVEMYRLSSGFWVGTELGGNVGEVSSVVALDGLAFAIGRNHVAQVFELDDGRQVFAAKLPADFTLARFWPDNGQLRLSSFLVSGLNATLNVDPVAVANAACQLGNWGATRVTVRDVAPDAPTSVADRVLCPAANR
jgi:WD40 repeat protein